MLESIADPVRLRVVRYLDANGAGSLTELADAAEVHVNTVRPHIQALEADGILGSRQRQARGPGRRVIEYYLAEPLSVTDGDVMAMAELLAAALVRAQVDEQALRRIGADWGRYLSGRPGDQPPAELLDDVLGRFGYRVQAGPEAVRLDRCLCPLVSPDNPMNICMLIEGVVDGALAASTADLAVSGSDHDPEARSCVIRLSPSGRA